MAQQVGGRVASAVAGAEIGASSADFDESLGAFSAAFLLALVPIPPFD
jgi:hypothetical protein